MKKLHATALLIALTTTAFPGTWTEYPLYLPPGVTSIGALSVNGLGNGFAGSAGPNNVIGPSLGLINGAWAYYSPPPTIVVRPSCSIDDATVYAIGEDPPSRIWRFEAPASWTVVALPGTYGFREFKSVAGVSATKWWATALDPEGDGVVYFEQGKPAKVWVLGKTHDPSHFIVVPRAANPTGEAYVMMEIWDFGYQSYRFALFVLKPNGEYTQYWVPWGNMEVEGIASPQPGEVRFTMTPLSGPSTLFKWSHGVFSRLQTFPERVWLRCYPSPTEGWGTTYGPKVYHWSDAGFSESYTLPGTVKVLDAVSVNDVWAGGSYGSGSSAIPKLWHYTSSGANIVPTSLGRVKATFK